jgi:hypothetical protein
MPKPAGNQIRSDIPIFYDCEATCIGGLPIEAGWAFVDTAAGEIQSESHLLKPPSHWDMKPVWDPDAEKRHGISLHELLAHRRQPFEVARRMNEALADRELFSDAPADDEHWLRIIFEEGGPDLAFGLIAGAVPPEPRCKLRDQHVSVGSG